ncbi:MAG: IspD/TarI family cytidylyltransferase [Sphaerochaetaceae bacterium]|jgi:2-C-methyl-D-erythritol 4-phosphate cytidylyltransferase/2-C-methyl-D-erythritol 4-phosphate cytidylyltransferase/2-C-methyl-D-erythritol 2,4-cyclodiphosphate synthase
MSFPSHAVIITAAGNSNRFNFPDNNSIKKKEFLLLDDRSVLYNATLPFTNIPSLSGIVVTYSPSLLDETQAALDNLTYTLSIPILFVEGGDTRQESVHLGLEAIAKENWGVEYVLIHDGARPWIDENTIISTLATATVFGGSAPILQINDAIKKTDGERELVEHLDRTNMVTVQTPQGFKFPQILEAHRKAALTGKSYVDDTEIFTDYGGRVGVCLGSLKNRKITREEDLEGLL